MSSIRLCAALVAVLSTLGVARAQSDRPLLAERRSEWPTEITRRPLTLAAGMVEVALPVNLDVSRGADAEVALVNPSLYFGATDRWMIGVRHLAGVCLGRDLDDLGDAIDGEPEPGCRDRYNDVSVDSVFSLGRGGGLDLAIGLSVNVAPLDPAAWSGEARLIARAGGGAFALTVAPTVNFGLNDRDVAGGREKWSAGSFNLGTYNLLRPVADAENKEFLVVPATLQLQLGPILAVAAGMSLEGPLNPSDGSFGDFYRIPVQGAAIVTPIPWIDVGAALTFHNLLGKNDSADFRALTLFAAFRI